MKRSGIFPGFSFALFLVIFILPYELILAQDQNAIPLKQQDKGLFKPSQHSLTLPLFDTLRPTLSICGKGLQYYDCIFLKHQDKIYLSNLHAEEKTIMTKATFTEMELEILEQNMLFINKQYQIQIKEWIRKEKMDLNLGEAIKGFYMNPLPSPQ